MAAFSAHVCREYYRLAKPGIIYGNLLTTVAAFLFASAAVAYTPASFLVLFIATTLGLALVIGSACVCNNYLDRAIDRKMERTSNRALVTGAISTRAALLYCFLLGISGLAFLSIGVNVLTMGVALFGWFAYVVVYGFAKRAGWWGALVGSVSGAVPIVVGYTAVANRLDLTALVLFLILVVWQMPHFYGIALYRRDEYATAGIPVLPIVKGSRITKIEIIGYIVLFLPATAALSVLGAAGYSYLFITLFVGLFWLFSSMRGVTESDPAKEQAWAKSVFLFSLIVLLVFSVALAAAPWLP